MKNKFLKISIVVLFISFFILLNWNSFNAPFERDEGEYAYSAWLLRTGDVPYRDSFLQKPPMIIYTYLIGQLINPLADWPPRAIAAVFLFLTSILVGCVAAKEWNKITGVFTSFLFLALFNFPYVTPYAANTEKFMILPIVSLLVLFVYYKNSQKSWPYILAGVFSVLAILYKPICLFVIIFIVLFWLIKLYYSVTPANPRIIIKPILLIGISSLVTTFIIFIPFLGAFPKFFQEVVVFNSAYIKSFGSPLSFFSHFLFVFLSHWWILLYLLLGFLVSKPKNFFFYFSLFIISLPTIFQSPMGHYYIMIIPFVALMCGALFNSLLARLTDKQKILATIVVLPVILIIVLFPFRKQFSLNGEGISLWIYGTDNSFSETKEVAARLSQFTDKNDSVFIGGSEPQIYYYSQRKSMTRFIITYPLYLNTPYQEQFQKELISDLEKNPPKAIIVSNRTQGGLWRQGRPKLFKNYLDELVSRDYNIVGGYVWENEKGHWQEPINDNQLLNASLLLYTQK